MNLRRTKKSIEYHIGAFVDDCSTFLNVCPGKDVEAVTGLVDEAVELFNTLRDRVVTPEGEKKAYYRGLFQELGEKLDSLYVRLSEIVKKNLEQK